MIGLAIALGLIFSIVVAGIIADRIRRKRDYYVRAPTNMYDKNNNMDRIPPSRLLGTIGQRDPGSPAPMI